MPEAHALVLPPPLSNGPWAGPLAHPQEVCPAQGVVTDFGVCPVARMSQTSLKRKPQVE